MTEFPLFGNPEDFLEEVDGQVIISYDRILAKVKMNNESALLGIYMLEQTAIVLDEYQDYDTVVDIILFFLEIEYIVFVEKLGFSDELNIMLNSFFSQISKDVLFLAFSHLNDYFDILEYNFLNDDDESERFQEHFFALYTLCQEIVDRGEVYILETYSFSAEYCKPLRNQIQEIQKSGKTPVINLMDILQEVKEDLLLKATK